MPKIVNEVRKGTYLDSVALMRMSRTIAAMDGIEECGMMMATPANKRIMADAGVLAAEGEAAGPGDLVIAIRAKDQSAGETAHTAAKSLLDKPKKGLRARRRPGRRAPSGGGGGRPGSNRRTDLDCAWCLRGGGSQEGLGRGLNVMMFDDNVPVEDEVALKTEARERGLLMMGPDCGTAIIGGVPLAFANVIPRGRIGIVGASGTGIQEVSCLIANNGGGISHAIGTGGRDLKKEVGGITTLMSIDLLDADPATDHIVIISKPPADSVAKAVIERVARSKKPFTICFLGATPALPKNATVAPTLEAAAFAALGKSVPSSSARGLKPARAKGIRGLFAGGTMCAEAQIVALAAGLTVSSNVPVPGAQGADAKADATLIDLGDDEYTLGRPHPMIEPAVRDAPLAAALADPSVGVVLIDCVLGFGGHADPGGHLAAVLAIRAKDGPLVIASVTGTEADPQVRSRQIASLEYAGVIVVPSNVAAMRMAIVATEQV